MAKKFLQINGESFEIAYEVIHNQAKENLVFLHGWGSNKEIMKKTFGSCFKDFNHFYIDLPGFGGSYNSAILNTQGYAQIIDFFLKSLGINEAVIVGHSFGGKIATLLNPKEMILLSSAGILHPKSFGVKFKIFLAKLLKHLGLSSKLLRSKDADSLNEAMYQTFKNVVDEDFGPLFSSSTSRAYIFWGKEDRATPLGSGEKMHSLFKKSEFLALEGDHFFFLHHAKVIEEKFLFWRKG